MSDKNKEVNYEHVINSLASEIANASIKSAKQNAVIIALSQENEELKKDNENLREQLGRNAKGNAKKK